MPTGDHEGVGLVPVAGVQGDAREVEGREQVRVPELGGERDAEQVEGADRAVAVDRELRHLVLAHERLEVGQHGVGAFGQRVGLLVEHLVQNLDALVRQTDLVGVRVHQGPAHRDGVVAPWLDDAVQLSADVLDGFAHAREQGLEKVELRLHDLVQARWSGGGGEAGDDLPLRWCSSAESQRGSGVGGNPGQA